MSDKPILFILSNNRDFIESLSNIVTRELKLTCKIATTELELQKEDVTILVTTNQLAGIYQFPIILVNLPIYINSLLAKIEEKLAPLTTTDIVEIATDWRLSPHRKILTHKPSGKLTNLTDKENQLLQVIAQSGEIGISRELLMKEVWKIDSVLDTHTLETHIYRLRKKIRDVFNREIIKAIEGGYKW